MTEAGTQGTLKDGTTGRPERAGWWFNQMRTAADKVPESAHHPVRSTELWQPNAPVSENIQRLEKAGYYLT